MTRTEAWFSHVAAALVGGTGLVYGWMRYFAESDDPFAIANHPWQPHFQHLHVLTAPLLVFACGCSFGYEGENADEIHIAICSEDCAFGPTLRELIQEEHPDLPVTEVDAEGKP